MIRIDTNLPARAAGGFSQIIDYQFFIKYNSCWHISLIINFLLKLHEVLLQKIVQCVRPAYEKIVEIVNFS
jgi:hypothetical protein